LALLKTCVKEKPLYAHPVDHNATHNQTAMIGKPVPVNPRKGRRLVIADVHGCAQTLKALVLENVCLQEEDQLFLLGDYLDRWPDPAGVLDFILTLKEVGGQVLPLRGNHEEYLLEAYNDLKDLGPAFLKAELWRKKPESQNLFTSQGELKGEYLAFFQSLPYYYELDRFFLVHSGFNFYKGNPFENTWHMTRMTTLGTNSTSKTIVHGHQITPLATIQKQIARRKNILPLDNGCYLGLGQTTPSLSPTRADFGRLCCLDLDTLELFTEANAD
jgi:serine/threonine protein phosphatase 1